MALESSFIFFATDNVYAKSMKRPVPKPSKLKSFISVWQNAMQILSDKYPLKITAITPKLSSSKWNKFTSSKE